MIDLKKYYMKKEIDSYKNEMYYHNITEAMNQIIRVKSIKLFFGSVVKKGYNVLDLGCGSGSDIINFSETFGSYNLSFIGVDLGRDLVKKLNSLKLKNIKFVNGDIENLYLKQKFDIITELEVAEHLEHFDDNLEVIKKHLKLTGYLIMSCPNKRYLLKDLYALLTKFKRSHIKTIAEHKHEQSQHFDEHINVRSYPEFKRKLENHGFEIVDKRRFMIHFGAKYLEPFYAIVAFVDWLLPKKIMYLGSGYVVLVSLRG